MSDLVTFDPIQNTTCEDLNCSLHHNASLYNTGGHNVSLDADFTLRIIYLIIGVVGMVGNSVVSLVILTSGRLRRKITNIFIANQSAIDFSTSLFIVLTSFIRDVNVNSGHIAKEIFCRTWKTNLPIWGLFVSSTYNLLAITLERFSALCYPLRHQRNCSRGKSRMVIAIVWIIGPAYNAAYMIPTSGIRGTDCTVFTEWPSLLAQRIVGILTICIQFFIPLIIITFAYIKIILVLHRAFGTKTKRDNQDNPQDIKRERRMIRARKNVIKTLVLVSLCFIICWSPNQIIYTMFNLGLKVNFNGPFYHFTVIAVFMNSCSNPFIYALQYDEFKAVIFRKCSKPVESVDSETSEQRTTQSVLSRSGPYRISTITVNSDNNGVQSEQFNLDKSQGQ